MSQFGIYILCHKADFRLTRGCCESIRCFAGEVPICLLVDGDFPTRALEKQYGCQTLRREQVRDHGLRTKSFGGWGYTKMVAFWEGPFDRFLYLDSDTLMLGNVCALAGQTNCDMILPEGPPTMYTKEGMSVHWLNPGFIARHFPSYSIYSHPYFTTGIFFGRRGLFDLDTYLRLLELQRTYPLESFRPIGGEQGLLNFMIFSAAEAGQLTYEVRPLQIAPLYMSGAEVAAINRGLDDPDAGWKATPTVIHYLDVKPSLLHERFFRWRGSNSEGAWPPAGWPTAMNRMRLRSYARCGYPLAIAVAAVLGQDFRYHANAWRKRRFPPRAREKALPLTDGY